MRPSPYTPDAELDALIHAGLGDMDPLRITADMRRRALAGEVINLRCRCGTCSTCASRIRQREFKQRQRLRIRGNTTPRPVGRPLGWRKQR